MPISNDQGNYPKGPWGGKRNGEGRRGYSSGEGGDFEDIIRNLQNQIKRFLPKRMRGGKGLIFVGLALIVIWLMSGFYRVEQGQVGVELVFGKLTGSPTLPGLNYNFPTPIGEVLTPEVERARRLEIGYRSAEEGSRAEIDVLEEGLILTGDQNIVDLDFAVFWKIKDAQEYLFNIRGPEETIKIAAESAMREVIGQTSFDSAVTEGRAEIERRTQDVLQALLDSYQAGIEIEKVDLQKSDPPAEVIDSFNDVQRARQDRDRLRNEAQAYANTIVPQARGQSEQTVREAEAYRERLIKESEGEAERFRSVLGAYLTAPEVTRRRMYLEAVGRVLRESDKVIIDNEQSGIIPYLPLPEIQKRNRAESANEENPNPS